MESKPLIYLDNNATTPIDNRVLEAMMPYLTSNFANANSSHLFGVGANDAVKVARGQVADLLGAEPHEITFTSGATEAINLAFKGIMHKIGQKKNHIITVSTEHSAVLDTCQFLEGSGYRVTYLPVGHDGLIQIDDLQKVITNQTAIVSVMFANNETGVIQPIKEISKIAHQNGAFFFTDATQAVGKIPIDVNDLGIDLMSFSGHKLYGPKGVGGLYTRQKGEFKTKLTPLSHGGGHERGLRSGTLNVPGIVGLGKACEIANREMYIDCERIGNLRDNLEKELLMIQDAFINGSKLKRIFNTINLSIPGIDSDALIMGLSNSDEDEQTMIAISNGSACTSHSIEPSHVLISMGLNEEIAFNTIRISLGRFNTRIEIEAFLNSLHKTIQTLKEMVK